MGLFSIKNKKIEAHLQLLGTLYLILQKVRKEGLISIEEDIEQPRKSPCFIATAPFDDVNAAVYTVLCDVLRLMVGGTLNTEIMSRYLAAARKTAGLTENQLSLFDALELTIIAILEGCAPQVAVEFGRQGIPAKLKPDFNEFEDFLRAIRTRTNNIMNRDETDAALVNFFDGIDK
jgi:flagellar motor component MotA